MMGCEPLLDYYRAVSGPGSKGYVHQIGQAHSFPSILVRMR